MPKPRSKLVTINALVDALYALDKRTRRSHTWHMMFVNRYPFIFFSKQQSTVESSKFQSELISMKICTEHIIALKFKL